MLAGLRGEESIAALCRREGISESLYYTWSKEFLEAGKQRLAWDTARQATSPEVKELRSEATALKEVVADELPVCQERLDRGRAEEPHTPFYRCDPLRGVGTNPMIEQCPYQGYPEPTCRDCQNENVYLARSKRPLRPIEREQPWSPKVQYAHNQPRGRVRVEPDELKEPLQATIVRGMQGHT